MNFIRIGATVFVVLLLLGCASMPAPHQGEQRVVTKVPKQISEQHPVEYIKLVVELMKNGREDEAVVWYYVAQMRFRAHLESNPDLEKSGDPALYASIKHVVGPPVNQYAAGDVDRWAQLVDEAIELNRSLPNGFTVLPADSELPAKIEQEFIKMRDYIRDNGEQIRQQRSKNGLPNR